MPDNLNERKSIVRLKERLIGEIPYVPQSAEAKQFLLNHDIGDLLHIYHFWRQRFLRPVPRQFQAPSSVRNDPLYLRNKARIDKLKQKILAGEDLSGYLSRRAHDRALDIKGYRESRSFTSSRDELLVCEGFYHLHLAPLPDRTDEILVAHVTADIFEVIGVFTHDLFIEDGLNPAYAKYKEAVNAYLASKLPSGGMFLGGPGGGMQNMAGSSIASTFWQMRCRGILRQAEAHPDGLNGFTIQLYNDIFGRQTRFVDPMWELAEDERLIIRDRKNKHDFWKEQNDHWKGQAWK